LKPLYYTPAELLVLVNVGILGFKADSFFLYLRPALVDVVSSLSISEDEDWLCIGLTWMFSLACLMLFAILELAFKLPLLDEEGKAVALSFY